MSEREGQRRESPLESERGTTSIEDIVVRRIAGRAAGEVAGIHMGGNTSRTAGGLLGRATGSSGDETRGVSAEVGRVEAALDLTMAVDYDRNILQVVGRVREKVEERVTSLTGLKITELNVTVSDVVFPDGQSRRDSQPEDAAAGGDGSERASVGGGSEDDTAPVREEAGPVRPREPVSRERSGGEDVYVEGTPVEEGETAELKLGEEARKRPSEGRGEGSEEGTGEGSGRQQGERRRDRRRRGGRGDRGGEERRDT